MIQYMAIFKNITIESANFGEFVSQLRQAFEDNPNEYCPIEETQLGAFTRCAGESNYKPYATDAKRALFKKVITPMERN